jgi:hypothetical protein
VLSNPNDRDFQTEDSDGSSHYCITQMLWSVNIEVYEEVVVSAEQARQTDFQCFQIL